MARNRMIKSVFWTDTKMCRLKRDVRLMYIGMWNFADDFGVIPADSMLIKSSVFPLDDLKIKDVEEWLSALEDAGVLIRFEYRGEQFFWIANFLKHQVVNRPNTKDVNVPKEVLDDIIRQYEEQQNRGKGTLTTQIQQAEEKVDNSKETDDDVVETTEETSADADYRKFNDWLSKNAPTVLKMSQPITKEEFVKLKADFKVDYIMDLLQQMHNWKPLLSKCKSAYLTFRNWARKDDERRSNTGRTTTATANGPRPGNAGISPDYAAGVLDRLGCSASEIKVG